MQKFKKERGWRIGDRLDSWDGPKIVRAIWLPHFKCFQVWALKFKGIYAMANNNITNLDNDLSFKNRIYKDEIQPTTARDSKTLPVS